MRDNLDHLITSYAHKLMKLSDGRQADVGFKDSVVLCGRCQTPNLGRQSICEWCGHELTPAVPSAQSNESKLDDAPQGRT